MSASDRSCCQLGRNLIWEIRAAHCRPHDSQPTVHCYRDLSGCADDIWVFRLLPSLPSLPSVSCYSRFRSDGRFRKGVEVAEFHCECFPHRTLLYAGVALRCSPKHIGSYSTFTVSLQQGPTLILSSIDSDPQVAMLVLSVGPLPCCHCGVGDGHPIFNV